MIIFRLDCQFCIWHVNVFHYYSEMKQGLKMWADIGTQGQDPGLGWPVCLQLVAAPSGSLQCVTEDPDVTDQSHSLSSSPMLRGSTNQRHSVLFIIAKSPYLPRRLGRNQEYVPGPGNWIPVMVFHSLFVSQSKNSMTLMLPPIIMTFSLPLSMTIPQSGFTSWSAEKSGRLVHILEQMNVIGNPEV